MLGQVFLKRGGEMGGGGAGTFYIYFSQGLSIYLHLKLIYLLQKFYAF